MLTEDDLGACVVAIKQAHDGCNFNEEGRRALRSAFILGKFFEVLMSHPELLDQHAKAGIARFVNLVHECLPPPTINDEDDVAFVLRRQGDVGGADALDTRFTKESRIILFGFMAAFVSSLQKDLVDLALRAHAAGQTDDSNYVIGMAEITANNFGTLAETSGDLRERDFDAVERFLVDGCRFTAAVRRELTLH